MAITYDAPNNLITVVGIYTDLHNDLWLADKAGTYDLHTRTSVSAVDGAAVAVDNALRPADYVVLGGTVGQDLYIVVTNWTNMTTADIRIIGTDRDGQAQTEDITVNGNGTYYATKWYKTVTDTQVTVFTKTDAGSFDYELTQGQWGVIWKQGIANYKIDDTYIIVGDGSPTTDCSDKLVNVLFETTQRWGYWVTNYATLTFGQQDSGYATSHGVNVNFNSSWGGYATSIIRGSASGVQNSKLNLYSCSLKATNNDNPDGADIAGISYFSTTEPNVVIYNCFFDKVFPTRYCDIYNLAIFRGLYGLRDVDGTLQQIFLYDVTYAISVSGASKTVKDVNIIAVDSATGIRYTGGGNDHYLINVDWSGASNWRFYWHGGGVPTSIFRQYEFDAHCIDEDGNDLSGVSVVADYISPHGQAFSTTTDVNGDIAIQIVDRSWYEQPTGNTENLKTPLTVTYSKAGFEVLVKYYDMAEPVKDCVVLCKVKKSRSKIFKVIGRQKVKAT